MWLQNIFKDCDVAKSPAPYDLLSTMLNWRRAGQTKKTGKKNDNIFDK